MGSMLMASTIWSQNLYERWHSRGTPGRCASRIFERRGNLTPPLETATLAEIARHLMHCIVRSAGACVAVTIRIFLFERRVLWSVSQR